MRVYVLTGVMGLTNGEARPSPSSAPEVFTDYKAARKRLLYHLAPYQESMVESHNSYQPITEIKVLEYPLLDSREEGLLASAYIRFWDAPHEGRRDQVFSLTYHNLED